MNSKPSCIAVLAFVAVVSNGQMVFACSCAGYPSPCGAFAEASAVLVGYVVKTEPEQQLSGVEQQTYLGEQKAFIRIEKSFKGRREGVIVLNQPGHICAPKFKVGERWLLYAHLHQKTKTWEVFGCGRSGPVESAHDDLLYLQLLPESGKRTRISGVLEHYEDTPERGFARLENVVGAKVKIIGEQQTYEVFTDHNGVYEFYDAPPGKYTIWPEIPAGLKVRFPMAFGSKVFSENKRVEVGLQVNSCAGSDFVLSSAAVIRGKVLDLNGKALPRVCLKLMPTDVTPSHDFYIVDARKKMEATN